MMPSASPIVEIDAAGTTVYGYTAAGQLWTEDGPWSSDTVTNLYANRMRTNVVLLQPTGTWTNAFTYDAARRLTSVTSPAGAFSYAFKSSSASRLPIKLSLPNTAYITNNYDGLARLTGTYLKNSGNTVLDSYVYVYDPANERTNLTRLDNSTVAYTYDQIGQLTIADSSVNTEDRGYLYDAAWNLNYRTNNGVLCTVAVDSKNQLTSMCGTTETYDSNGNLATNGILVYYYDDENRLTRVEDDTTATFRTDFVYDGLSRMRKRLEYVWQSSTASIGPLNPSGSWVLTNTVLYIYDGNRVVQERNVGNTPVNSYTRGPDLSGTLEGAGGIGGLLARSFGYSSGTGNWSTHDYYHADGNGNITYLVDSSQNLAASYRYDPFGNQISSSGTLAATNVYRFSSKEVHANSGMYYYLYRFYDPNLQRWLDRDPTGEAGGLNLYSYAANDPLDRLDPFGEADLPKDHPPKTSPPIFPDDRFEVGRDNCLCYALDRPGGELQPDTGSGAHNAENCKGLIKQIKRNYKGVGDVPKNGKCPDGTHKIAVFSDEGTPGFHVQRQDQGANWSEMSKGFGAGQTYGPRKCTKGKGPGKYCGDLCAPDQPKPASPSPLR